MKPKDADEKKASYFDMTFEVFGELDDTEDNEVEMIVVGRPRPRRWPRRRLPQIQVRGDSPVLHQSDDRVGIDVAGASHQQLTYPDRYARDDITAG